MRILELTAYFPPSIGGIQYYVETLSQHLARRGHQITVMTVNTEDGPTDELTPEGVRVHRCKLDTFVYRAVISRDFIKRLLASRDYDVYHMHIPFHLGLEAAGLASRRNGIPLITTFHGQHTRGSCLYTGLASAYSCFSRLISMRAAARTIFLSRSYAGSIWLPPCIQHNLRTVKTGADVEGFKARPSSNVREAYGIPPSAVVFLFVGSLHRANRYKGVDYLIRAFAALRSAAPNARLMIAGGGELLAPLRDLVAAHDLQASVILTGTVPHTKLPDYYAACDVAVLPSIHGPENSPMVVLEAMACSRPVVASRLPGLCELVEDGRTGLLVEPRNVAQLAAAMQQMAQDRALRRRMGDSARASVQAYSWERCTCDVEAVLHEVVG